MLLLLTVFNFIHLFFFIQNYDRTLTKIRKLNYDKIKKLIENVRNDKTKICKDYYLIHYKNIVFIPINFFLSVNIRHFLKKKVYTSILKI